MTARLYRVPGPYGLGDVYGPGCWLRGPRDRSIFVPHTRGPMGTNEDAGAETATARAATGATSAADARELELLQDVYGVISAGGNSYQKKVKGTWQNDVEAYVRDRDAFFGSEAEYQAYKATALGELDASAEKLRKVIEPNANVRKAKNDWKEAQTVFYCWVRRAYEKHGDVPPGTDIPKLILSGTSEKLREALKKVRVDYGKQFQAGGFNPRPMKLAGKYRLGTLSEHAIGNAIDIDDSRNAQITSGQWTHLLAFTGKKLDHATRKSKWKSAPRELYDLIAEIDREFVKRLDEATRAAAQEKPVDPLEAALANDTSLKKIGTNFLRRWQKGFLGLEWELVKELHEEGFVWGATFPDPDLHHFEL